ncbi:alpha/beta fold hydrolase, partial [Streptomyces fuscigenes]|uniref:alpha/beta fold hydrolase n=1 Tax=Streptomyces fuscigenes TaxID=1528880 RepID=UPI001F363420
MPEHDTEHRVRRTDVIGADGVRLAAWEYARRGGDGSPAGRRAGARAPEPGVLLLHGLMGRASHWDGTARWLSERHRVVAYDQRGHGLSERPADGLLTREAYVADAEAVVESMGLGPVTLVGHAMGALTAWQLAARRPDLVRALVIFDMRASALGAASQQAWEEWFRTWPVPFESLGEARRWFAEEDPWLGGGRIAARGDFHAEMLARREDGWRPLFSRRQMLRTRETWVLDAHWDELAQVSCPTLVVRGRQLLGPGFGRLGDELVEPAALLARPLGELFDEGGRGTRPA